MEPIFFEIPIYRISNKTHDSEMESMREKHYNLFPSERIGKAFEGYQQFIEKRYWYPWKYNEIIGYLNLYIFGTQLRVDFWIIDNKRLTKGIHKKTFYKSGKALEASVDKNKSSNEIFDWILEQLNALQVEEIFKNRHFDLSTLKVLGRFIDWKSLCRELNSWAK